MPSNRLIPWLPLLLLSSIFPSIKAFSNELDLHIRGPKYWASVLMNILGWFLLGLTNLICSLSQELWQAFSSTTVQLLGTQPFLGPNFHIHTWLLENHTFDYTDLCQQSDVSAF